MRITFFFFALAALCLTSNQKVSGDLLIEMLQIGNDVVVTSGGTVDTTNLEFVMGSPSGGGVLPAPSSFPNPFLITGFPFIENDSNPIVDLYFNTNFGPVVGPSSFGSSPLASFPDSGSGDLHGLFINTPSLNNPFIIVPEGYVSGDLLSSQMTFHDTSFVDLGVTEGIYNWSFTDNEITLSIAVALGLPTTLGDVNLDGEVTFSDIPSFVDILIAGSFLKEADCNEDGEVNFADIDSFVEILITG